MDKHNVELDAVVEDGDGAHWQIIAISRRDGTVTLQELDDEGEQTDEQRVVDVEELVEDYSVYASNIYHYRNC